MNNRYSVNQSPFDAAELLVSINRGYIVVIDASIGY